MVHVRIVRATPWFLQGDLTAIEGVPVATPAGVTA
jgi:hypothetical protein